MRIVVRATAAILVAALMTSGLSVRSVQATTSGGMGRIAFSLSAGGSQLIYSIAYDWTERDATDLKQLTTAAQSPHGDFEPTWSPGGSFITFTRKNASGKGDIWIMNHDGTGQRQLTTNAADDIEPDWSPDGARIGFASNRDGDYEILTMDPNGGTVKSLTKNLHLDKDPAWSPDGKHIAFISNRPVVNPTGTDIYVMDPDGSKQTLIGNTDTDLHDLDWRADGQWIIATMDNSGFTFPYQPYVTAWKADNTSWVLLRPGVDGSYAPGSNSTFVSVFLNVAPAELAVGNDLSYPLAHVAGVESSPDWQAIPAFQLVDAQFSPFNLDIQWIFNAGLTKGCSIERYCPNDNVTRGQMAAFLSHALELPETATDYFTDDDGTTFEKHINRLREAGITFGCTATTYCPNGTVTRGQMAAFLSRALDLPATATDYFTDDEESTFEDNINRLRASGITSGCTPTTFCPDGTVTRGQMAAFLHRAFGP